MGIIEGGGGGEGHLSLDVLFVVVGLNSSRLLLKEEVRLVVGFCGEGGGWLWGWGEGVIGSSPEPTTSPST